MASVLVQGPETYAVSFKDTVRTLSIEDEIVFKASRGRIHERSQV